MPEEIEVPTEHLQETIHEAAHEGGSAHEHGGKSGSEHEGGGSFNMKVALSTALLAVIAAVAALLAGHAANEALLEQIKATNEWNHYQSKSIKDTVLSSKLEMLASLDKKVDPKDLEKQAEYKRDMEELKNKAEEQEAESGAHMRHHVILARSVTLFQIAIALAAIAVLTKKAPLWFCSLALGGIGAIFFVAGII